MKKQKIKHEFNINHFATYGLNRYRNFLSAPQCECGCGGKDCVMVLNTDQELCQACSNLVIEHECPDAAVFCVKRNGDMIAVIKHWNEDRNEYTATALSSKGYDFFSQLDGEMRFCCYGLIIEVDDGQWQICE